MSITPNDTVRAAALAHPAAPRLFEKLGLDYCCGGHQTLAAACERKGLTVETVIQSLAALPAAPATDEPDLTALSLTALTAYIVAQHHTFTVQELARITPLLAKVCTVHGANHAELSEIADSFAALRQELTPHLLKEERVLFPYIAQLEAAAQAGPPAPSPPFGTVRNPVRMMALEHDHTGALLSRLRHLAQDYTPPADACFSYRTLYAALADLERDLHRHIHLENNLLFPRAVELENSLREVKQQ